MRVREDVSSGGVVPCDHGVTFYESDQFLIDSTVAFLGQALRSGAPAVAVATREHLRAIEAALAEDVADDQRRELLVMIDADEMLSGLMVDGTIDPTAFDVAVGQLFDDLPRRAGRPHIFGEMVAMLWEQGNVTGALALEDMWNELARVRSFVLSCAYPLRAFDAPGGADAIDRVCDKHTAVTPTETHAVLRPDEQPRHVARLQQQARTAARERDALRRERDEFESALQHLQEMDRIRSEFVAMVVHDIRSPAGVVSASLELLLEGLPDISEDDARQVLTTAAESNQRIHRLVDDLLLTSRLESGSFTFDLRPGQLSSAVARATGEVQAPDGRPIEIDLPFDLPPVLMDEDRQVQILTNLLSNAVKFSPQGSPVRVSVESRDDQLAVHVHNEGAAISPEDQGRLFLPFSRLATTGRGTGLGLYIAKALVEGQGGQIWVDSDPRRGTTFSYSLVQATA